MDQNVLEVKNICKKYRARQVLSGASFTAGSGECVGIVGTNGCGKTTLLSILAGVNAPDHGSVSWNGNQILGSRRQTASVMAYVPQENPLMEELSVEDNLLFWYRGDRARMKQDLDHGAPGILGVKEMQGRTAAKLSGGMKKRLSIACALADHAPVLILDEPGAALDLECKQIIWRYLEQYKAQGGTLILTSHEMTELEHCSRMYLLKQGMLQEIAAGLTAQQLVQLFTKQESSKMINLPDR